MTLIFAHRGYSGYYPENTMLAFQKVAEETKADGIEFDVQLTKDQELVVMHDELLDRTTNGSGYLKDFTLAELKELSVGKETQGDFPRQTIPTAREFFTWFKDTSLLANIELKTSVFEYEGIEKKLVDLVKEYHLEDRVWYSSFNHRSAVRVHRELPNAVIGLLCDAWLINAGQYVATQGAQTFNCRSYYAAQPGICDEIHSHGVKVQAWTPNTKEEMKALVDNHVDVLITNFPNLASEVIGR